MKRYDRVLDLLLRILVFSYSVLLLSISIFKLTRDRQFVIAIGLFAVICTGLYLFDGIYRMAKGQSIPGLQRFIYGEENVQHGELAPIAKVLIVLAVFGLLFVSMKLFGVFVSIFVFMVLFPPLYGRQKIAISLLMAVLTCGAFYYVFVYMMGVGLTKGLLFGV